MFYLILNALADLTPLNDAALHYTSLSIFLLVLLILAFIANALTRIYILKLVTYLIERTATQWDDILLENHVFRKLSHLAPALVIYIGSFMLPPSMPMMQAILERLSLVYITITAGLSANAFLNGVLQIYNSYEVSRNRPIRGYIQALRVLLVLLCLIFVVSSLLDRQPMVLLGTLGAFTAVLMLVFKDPILGFVAGIQLAGNNMVRKGDWIVADGGADGDVLDVTLTSVVVQNWDKTITTVPVYNLVSQPFTNWRGMSESGGRRIKRAISLDMNTIRFCDQAMLERFQRIDLLKDYLAQKLGEIGEERKHKGVLEGDNVNGRMLTNVGTFRAYIAALLKANPNISQELTFLVRQLPPGESGLPIELYVFSNKQDWVTYENIQSDIFDHLLAVLPEFGLRAFQKPSGSDVRALTPGVNP